jgi:hypothetical protein
MPLFPEIDLGRLEEHWVAQDGLHRKYASRLALAKKDLLDIEEEVKAISAETKHKIRMNPKLWDLKSVTENSVKEAWERSKTCARAVKKLNEAKYSVDVLTGVLVTLEHRKRALENLVTLHGQSYFSKPRVSSEVEQAAKLSLRDGERKLSRGKPLKRKKKHG